MKNILLFLLAISLIFGITASVYAYPPSLSGPAYSMADLVGTWESNGLRSPGPWWQRGAVTIGSDGSFTGMFEGSDGSSKSLSGIFSITADGIITATGSNPNPSHRCVMDSGKSIVVCTNSNDSGSTTEMHIFVKKD